MMKRSQNNKLSMSKCGHMGPILYCMRGWILNGHMEINEWRLNENRDERFQRKISGWLWNGITRRKLPTCRKSLTNIIT